MRPAPKPAAAQPGQLLLQVFAALFGGFLGLTLLKFGNPPIMEKWVSAPTGVYEYLLGYPWPIGWAYGLLAVLSVAGAALARWRTGAPRWLILLPLMWLVWQIVAGTRSLDAALSAAVVKHFGACVLCFYLGLFSLSRLEDVWPFWLGLLCGLVLVLATGWDQHFGGLQATRRYFFLYIYPTLKEMPPEYLKRISSNRIFATLFYPNALAGALLLLLPVSLATIWQARRLLTAPARGFLIASLGIAGLAVLYWSGSKGGWLLMLMLGVIALLRLPFAKQLKVALVVGMLVAGLAGFFWKHAGFFRKGATSVSARFDYWRAAIQTARDDPAFGTGPGTFSIPYQKIKRPESEMARLVHNDYLEQASDSGLVGFLTYTVFIISGLIWCFPRPAADWQTFAVWLGVLGWSLQGFVEFGLYIPALAWPAFAFLGWLLGKSVGRASVLASPNSSETRSHQGSRGRSPSPLE